MSHAIGTVVPLSLIEYRLAQAIGNARYRQNRRAGVSNARIGPQDDAETDVEGAAAELAFCKLFDLYPGDFLDVSPRSSAKGSDGGDVVLHGRKVDVKRTGYDDGALPAAPWKRPMGIDCYALFTGGGSPVCGGNYTFRGFITAADLLVPDRYYSRGDNRRSYWASQRDLVEFDQLDFRAPQAKVA